jgi:hypothetical protein
MNLLVRIAGAGGVALIGTLSGCLISSGCEIRPILGQITAPGLGEGGHSVGACVGWVDYEGGYFRDSRGEGWEFAIGEDQIEPIGEARGATALVGPLADATVYAIDGVDPDDAIAMRAPRGADPAIIAFVFGDRVPAELCRYADYEGAAFSMEQACGPAP